MFFWFFSMKISFGKKVEIFYPNNFWRAFQRCITNGSDIYKAGFSKNTIAIKIYKIRSIDHDLIIHTPLESPSKLFGKNNSTNSFDSAIKSNFVAPFKDAEKGAVKIEDNIINIAEENQLLFEK